MELISPTMEVLEDQRVTLQELEWYGQQLAGIALVALVGYVLGKIVEGIFKGVAQ